MHWPENPGNEGQYLGEAPCPDSSMERISGFDPDDEGSTPSWGTNILSFEIL